MKDNNDVLIPFVPPELIKYLRDKFSLGEIIHQTSDVQDSQVRFGIMLGAERVLSYLEALRREQEGDN